MLLGKKSPPIFYGWWIVAACFMVALYSAGVISYGFTAIIEPLVTEFGWSYAQISLATALRGVEVGLGAPLVGWLVDRFGARPVMIIGASIMGVGLVLLSHINSLLTFYAVYGLVSVGTTICGTTAIMAVVAKWFHRRVSTAIGITICGFGSSGLMVQLVVRLVDSYGWRAPLISYFGTSIADPFRYEMGLLFTVHKRSRSVLCRHNLRIEHSPSGSQLGQVASYEEISPLENCRRFSDS